MRKSVLSLSAIVFISSAACGQAEPKKPAAANSDPDKVTATGGVMATGWTGRIDPQSEKQGRKITDVKFVTMGTGYHVTAGPAAVYWNPSNTASGNYEVTTTISQGKAAAHAEGYGIVLAGKDLDKANQSYFYFLVRQDGKFLLNHRANDSTVHKIVNWTENAAINKVPEGGKSTNALKIDVGPSALVFSVNGTEVHRIPRSTIDSGGDHSGTAGIAGLRVNHNLDVHVDNFVVTQAK